MDINGRERRYSGYTSPWDSLPMVVRQILYKGPAATKRPRCCLLI